MKINEENKIGLIPLIAMVAGNMMGSGVFMLPANLAQIGSISLWGWIFTTLGALALALVFSTLGMIKPKAGGPYAYVKESYGDFLGFQTVYVYWLAAWIGNIAIAIVSVGYLSYFLPILKEPWPSCLASLAIVWFFTLANAFGPKIVGKLQTLTTTIMLIPLLGLSILGCFWFSPSLFKSAYNISGHSNFSAISSAASLALWAFIGVESAAVSAGVVKNPQRNIPLATLFGVGLAALVYISSTAIIMGVIPNHELATSASPFALMASYILGPTAGQIVSLCAILACFGTLAGWTLLVGQSAKAAADDALFPAIFGKVNRYQVPFLGLVIVAICMSFILIATIAPSLNKQFAAISLITVFLSLLPYLYSATAAIIIGYRAQLSQMRFAILAVVAFISLVYTFWTIVGAGTEIIAYGTLIVLISVPLYLIVLWRRRRLLVGATDAF